MRKMEKLRLQVLTAVLAGTVSVSIGGGFCSAAQAAAEEKPAVDNQAIAVADFGDEDVVVTATRTAKRDIDVPASTEIITAKQIHDSGATNAAQVLKMVNGFAYKSFGPSDQNMGTMTNELNIRGFGNGTLVLVNGIDISQRGKYDISSIAAENIERIEVIKGNGSVLYGSSAIGGVVNIITKTGEEFNSVYVGFGNRNKYRYSLNAGDDKMHFSYSKEKYGSRVTNSDKTYPSGSSYTAQEKKAETEYVTHDVTKENLNIAYKFNDKWDVLYNFSQSMGTIDRMITDFAPGYTSPAKIGDMYQDRHYNTTMHNFIAKYHDNDWIVQLFNTTGYIESTGITNGVDATKKKNYHTKEKNTSYGVDVQKTWHLNDNATLTAGINGKREMYNAYVASTPANCDRNDWAAFIEWEQKVDNKNTFILGGRETWTSGAFRDQNFNNFSASGSWVHNIDEESNLYATVAQTFLMPTLSQINNKTDYAIPNPNLKPQHGINYEIGWKKHHDAHTWKAAVFYTDVEDNISASWTKTKQYKYTNEDFRNTGLELALSIDDDKPFSFNFGLTWQNPEYKNSVKKYWDRCFGKLQLTTGITYKIGKFTSNLDVSYLCDRVYKQESSSTERNVSTKPYLLTDLNFIYVPDKNNEFSLQINNVLNRRDRVTHDASGYYTSPADFMLGYTYKF